MWAHLGVTSMPHAPSTMPAKSPATARTGTGISWHSYIHENSQLRPSVRLKAPQLAKHSGLTIVGQWLAIAKVATRSIAQCCFPTARFKTPGGLPTGPDRKPMLTASPGLKQLPGGNVPEGTPSAPKEAPNLNVPRPSATPGQPGSHGNQLAGSPTPKPAGNLASGQNLPQASATPKAAVKPPQE